LQKISTTGYSLFELVNGHMLVALHTVLSRGYVKSPRVKRF